MENENPIPKQLQKEEFRFILLNEKIPIEENWQTTNNYRYNHPELLEHIRNGKNYGVVCGYGGLFIMDADHKLIENVINDKFPRTFKVHNHYYFICKDAESYKLKHNEETVADFQYHGKQVVGAGSVHPETNNIYKIQNDLDIAEIDFRDVVRVFPKGSKDIFLDMESYKILNMTPPDGKTYCKVVKPMEYNIIPYETNPDTFKVRFKQVAEIKTEDDLKAKRVFLELPFRALWKKFCDSCCVFGINEDTDVIYFLVDKRSNKDYRLKFITENEFIVNVSVKNIVNNIVNPIVKDIGKKINNNNSKNNNTNYNSNSILHKVKTETKRLELLRILNDPSANNNSRVYLVKFLNYVGYTKEDSLKIIENLNKWSDYNPQTTLRHLEALYK